jgi:argininosuccinate lyase
LSKLWDKGYALDKLIEEFTVGDDPLLDQRLVAADCIASMAHAKMLSRIDVLTPQEYEALRRELSAIVQLNLEGRFSIRREEEDCHTAIENRLVESVGEAGKKIHTGRSRNDQVIAALRLYTRSFLLEFQGAVLDLVQVLLVFAERYKDLPMPGRTHLQVAMPSSIGLWTGAWLEELLDDLLVLDAAYSLNNSCPLGSAASYGVPLPLDREMVAESLAFDRVQNNVLYVNNSRGKFESIVLDAVEQVVLTLSKLAQDLILFSLPEFGYFRLPDELFAGSSIMPQKKNPCMLELLRAKAATVSSCSTQVKSIIRALPSGYNRDFQETKAPFLRGLDLALISVRVMREVIEKLEPDAERLREGFTPDIYATDRALELVARGMPFRDAYRSVGTDLGALEKGDPDELIRSRTYTGTSGNLGLDLAATELGQRRDQLISRKAKIEAKLKALAGFNVSLQGQQRSAGASA